MDSTDPTEWREEVPLSRREIIAAVGTAGAVGVAGCGTVGAEETLLNPTVNTGSSGRRSMEWTSGGETVGEFGVDPGGGSGVVGLSTELSHEDGTSVESILLRARMPETESAADVAVVSPVEGDSSAPPSLSLFTPDRKRGTAIEVDDLDDLADETISTLDLMVRPPSPDATTLVIDATIDLAGGGIASKDYTLEGRLELPDIRNP